MANLTTTNVDLSTVVFNNAEFKDELLVATGAKTFLAGTILARKRVADAVVADGTGNTGDGTCTLTTVADGPIVPLVGAYNLECVEAITNGGRFKLVDPNGAELRTDLLMTAGAGAATAFETHGLKFTLTDAATDFIVGDKFSLTVAADGKMVVYATDGAGGAQIPTQVLTVETVASGAGNIAVRPLYRGVVRRGKLVIDADGDGSNVTNAVLDMLQDYGIGAEPVTELNIQDNQ